MKVHFGCTHSKSSVALTCVCLFVLSQIRRPFLNHFIHSLALSTVSLPRLFIEPRRRGKLWHIYKEQPTHLSLKGVKGRDIVTTSPVVKPVNTDIVLINICCLSRQIGEPRQVICITVKRMEIRQLCVYLQDVRRSIVYTFLNESGHRQSDCITQVHSHLYLELPGVNRLSILIQHITLNQR